MNSATREQILAVNANRYDQYATMIELDHRTNHAEKLALLYRAYRLHSPGKNCVCLCELPKVY